MAVRFFYLLAVIFESRRRAEQACWFSRSRTMIGRFLFAARLPEKLRKALRVRLTAEPAQEVECEIKPMHHCLVAYARIARRIEAQPMRLRLSCRILHRREGYSGNPLVSGAHLSIF